MAETLSPLAKKIEDIINAVWKAQKFGRRLRINKDELLDILRQVTALEQGNKKTPVQAPKEPITEASKAPVGEVPTPLQGDGIAAVAASPELVKAMLPEAPALKKTTPQKKGS
jgi:hypothetical protein